jgi:hypothetical protein
MTDPRETAAAPGAPDEPEVTMGAGRLEGRRGEAPDPDERFAHLHGGEWVAMDFDDRAYTCAQCGISLRV